MATSPPVLADARHISADEPECREGRADTSRPHPGPPVRAATVATVARRPDIGRLRSPGGAVRCAVGCGGVVGLTLSEGELQPDAAHMARAA
eukprot:7319842-Prymnesium_polylepis.1